MSMRELNSGLLTRMNTNTNTTVAVSAADEFTATAANNNNNNNNVSSTVSANVVRQVEDYNHILNSIGLPNYGTIKSLFSPGEGATPADTMPAIQVSFELFETVQNRFAATKLTLERTKADLLLRNQQYSALQGTLQTLKEEFAVLQKRAAESEERNTAFNQLVARQEVSLEQLRREVGQARTEIELVQEKLTRREEELQESQNRVTEGLVTISQKDAAITALRRELGKLGRFHRKNSGSANPNDPNRAAGEEYSAEALQSIAAEVEARSQEARMKLTLANLEAKLRRTEQEKDVVLEQHEKYRRHVERTVAVYETQCMQLHDAMAQHKCVRTPYYLSSAYYSPLLEEEDEEEYEGNSIKDHRKDEGEEDGKAPFRSFQALTYETRRLLDRVAKISVDKSSAMKEELEDCAAAYRKALEANTELVGFLGTFESEVTTQRHTLPEVREEWAKARIPFFVSKVAHELQESVTALGKSFVQLLQRENEYRQSLAQRMQTTSNTSNSSQRSSGVSGQSTSGNATRQNSLAVPVTMKAFANAATMTLRVRKISQATQVMPEMFTGEEEQQIDNKENDVQSEGVEAAKDMISKADGTTAAVSQEMGSMTSSQKSQKRDAVQGGSPTRMSSAASSRATPHNPLGRSATPLITTTTSKNHSATMRPPRYASPGSRVTSANSHVSQASFAEQKDTALTTTTTTRSQSHSIKEYNTEMQENDTVNEDERSESEASFVHDVIHVELPFTCPHCTHLITRDDLAPIAGLASPNATPPTPAITAAALLSTLPYRAPGSGDNSNADTRRSTAHEAIRAATIAIVKEEEESVIAEEEEEEEVEEQHRFSSGKELHAEEEGAVSARGSWRASVKETTTTTKDKKKGSQPLSRSSLTNADKEGRTSPSKQQQKKKKKSTCSTLSDEGRVRSESKCAQRSSLSPSTSSTSVAVMHSRLSRSRSSVASQQVSARGEGKDISVKEKSLSRHSTPHALSEGKTRGSQSVHSTHALHTENEADVRKMSGMDSHTAADSIATRHGSNASNDVQNKAGNNDSNNSMKARQSVVNALAATESDAMKATQETIEQLRAAVQLYELEQVKLRELRESAEHVATQTDFTSDYDDEQMHNRRKHMQQAEESEGAAATRRSTTQENSQKEMAAAASTTATTEDKQTQLLPPMRPVSSAGSHRLTPPTAPPSPNDARSEKSSRTARGPAASLTSNAQESLTAALDEEKEGVAKGGSEGGKAAARKTITTKEDVSKTARVGPTQKTTTTSTRPATQKASAAAQARRVPPVLPSVTTTNNTTTAQGNTSVWPQLPSPSAQQQQTQQQQRVAGGLRPGVPLSSQHTALHNNTTNTSRANTNRTAVSPAWHMSSQGAPLSLAIPHGGSNETAYAMDNNYQQQQQYAFISSVDQRTIRQGGRGAMRMRPQLHGAEANAYGFNVSAARLNASGAAQNATMSMLPGLQVRGLQQQQSQQTQSMYGNRPAPPSRHHAGHIALQPLPIARHFIRLSGDDQPFASTMDDDIAQGEETHWANLSSNLHHHGTGPFTSSSQPPTMGQRYSAHAIDFSGFNNDVIQDATRKDVVERYERYVLQQLLRRRFSDRPTTRQAFRSSLNKLFHMPYLHPTHPASASAQISLSSDGPSVSRPPGLTPPSSAAMAHGVSIYPVHGTGHTTSQVNNNNNGELTSMDLTVPSTIVPSLMMTGHQIGSKPWTYGHLGTTQSRTMQRRRWSGERGRRARRIRYAHRHPPSPPIQWGVRSGALTSIAGMGVMARPLTPASPSAGPMRPTSATARPVVMTLMPQANNTPPLTSPQRGFSPLQVLRRRGSPLLARRDPYVRRVKHTRAYVPPHMRPTPQPHSAGFGRTAPPSQQQQQSSGLGGLQGQGMMHP